MATRMTLETMAKDEVAQADQSLVQIGDPVQTSKPQVERDSQFFFFFPHTDQDSSRTLGSPALRAPEAATDLVGGWTVLMMVGWRWVWHEMELVFLAEMPCYICFNRCAFDPLTCQEGQANLASVEGIAKR